MYINSATNKNSKKENYIDKVEIKTRKESDERLKSLDLELKSTCRDREYLKSLHSNILNL